MQLSLNKLPWYGQVGVFAAVSAMALGAYFYFYDSTARAEVAAKQQQLAGLHAEIARGRQLAARLPEFRAQVVDLEARLDGLKAVLPEQKDVGDLLRRIQTLAAQSNLEVRGFKPQPIAQKQMHAEWPIAIELDGTYHDLGAFFDRVSKVPRIINVSSVTIKAKGQQGARAAAQAAEGKTISAHCVATTFVLSEAPATAPTKGPGKGAKPAAAPAATRKP
jgi:type IV pilus assembly protein PilO